MWKGESCYWVTRAALLLVIDTREGLKEIGGSTTAPPWWERIRPVPTVEPSPAFHLRRLLRHETAIAMRFILPALVYADHYFQARGDSSRMGHIGYPFSGAVADPYL